MNGGPQAQRALNDSGDGALWAVTAYFNPQGYERRLLNYQLFRQHLQLPLLTMFLDHGSGELGADDASILVRFTQGDVLWQKERLFNLALSRLPESCSKLLWLDADVLFPAPGWHREVEKALDEFEVLQPFNRVYHLPPTAGHADLEGPPSRAPDEWGVAWLRANGHSLVNTRATAARRSIRRAIAGVAWATTRSFAQDVGFYDAMAIGSGDVAFWSGVSGDHGIFHATPRPPALLADWSRWERSAVRRSGGRVGSLDSPVLNLWHGDHSHRRYADRWQILQRHAFDPVRDLAASTQGPWLWDSDKPRMHDEVARYFASRREDG